MGSLDLEREEGFSATEALLALVLTLIVVSAAGGLLAMRLSSARVQPESIDMHQRLRASLDVVSHALVMAGAGIDDDGASGPLNRLMAPVVPRRIGLSSADAPTIARPDALSVTYVPLGASSALTMDAVSGMVPAVTLTGTGSCPIGRPFCGYREDDTILIADRLGSHGFYLVAGAPVGDTAVLSARQPDAPGPFAAGAVVAGVETHTFYFDRPAGVLRHYDGRASDVPVVDQVADVRFEYWGDPRPPVSPKPPAGFSNCLYDSAGTLLGTTAPLPSSGESMVALPLSLFVDGPWCGTGGNRFDVDLLRIRRVRLFVRVRAASDALRSQGTEYAVAGISTSALRALPDQMLSIDVSPRNLHAAR